MKNKILLWLSFFCATLSAQAQSFDDIMVRSKYVTCQDVNFNAAKMISKLYGNNQIDSLSGFLEYWQSKCGRTEQIFRLQQLLDIKTANFDNESISDEFLNYLIAYKPYTEHNEFFFHRYSRDFENDYTLSLRGINAEILKIATEIELTYTEDESLIKSFYSTDTPSFYGVKKASEESKLRKIYEQRVQETLELPEFNFALFTGYYQPFGKIELFGPHPTIGLIGGVKKFRHNFDIVMDIRMGRSKNEYEFIYKGNLMKDDKWTGIYFGFEYTFDFIYTKKFRAGVSPGFGYDEITALHADNDYGEKAKILPSYDINGGLAFKYLFGKTAYLGLQARYHWVDHRNTGGTELSGNYFSTRLIIGSVFNYERSYKLKQLE